MNVLFCSLIVKWFCFEGHCCVSMCRHGLPHQQTVKKSSVHFTERLTTVLLLACSFLSNVPPPAPPPAASSSGLLGPDERTATRARKCTACLLSPCSCSTSFTETPVGKNMFPCKRRPVCLNQGGKVENFFPLTNEGAQFPLAALTSHVVTNRSQR